jgi:hypothetical protein
LAYGLAVREINASLALAAHPAWWHVNADVIGKHRESFWYAFVDLAGAGQGMESQNSLYSFPATAQ